MKLSWALIALCTTTVASGEPALSQQDVAAAAARIDMALERALVQQSDRTVNRGATETPVTTPATDEEFLRRVSADLAGRLPTAREVRAFVNDAAADKRARAIDQLVAEPAAGNWRFERMAEPLRVVDEVLGVSQAAYVTWLQRAFAQDLPVDRIMTDLLSARGSLEVNPAAGFLLRDYGHIKITVAELARAFLGEDIHCAGCHDHPFSDHTQRGFFEFAACFNVVHARSSLEPSPTPAKTLLPGARPLPRAPKPPPGDGAEAPARPDAAYFRRLELAESALPLRLPADYKYRDGKPFSVVEPRFLMLEKLPGDDPRSAFLARPSPSRVREQVVLWFAGRENGALSSASALRIWDWMFGVPGRPIAERQAAGFSDPVPPHLIWQGKGCGQPVPFSYGEWLETRPDFVAALRWEFERCNCRIGQFQRVLAHTRAYRQQALPADEPGRTRLLPAPVIRRLPAEIVWDSLVSWLPAQERQGQWRACIDLPQVPEADHPLRLMGRGSRQWADESRPAISHQLARLMIAAPIVERVTRADSMLVTQALAGTKRENLVEELFLAILGRMPRDTERTSAMRHLSAHPKTAAGDLAWALLNTREFLFQH